MRKKSQKIRHRFPQIRANRKQIKTIRRPPEAIDMGWLKPV